MSLGTITLWTITQRACVGGKAQSRTFRKPYQKVIKLELIVRPISTGFTYCRSSRPLTSPLFQTAALNEMYVPHTETE